MLLAINSKMNLWIHLDTFGGLITHLTQTDNYIKGNTLPFPQGDLSTDELLDILHPIPILNYLNLKYVFRWSGAPLYF